MLVYGDFNMDPCIYIFVHRCCYIAAFVLDTSMFVFINSRWKQHM